MKTITGKSYTRITLALDIIRKIDDGPYKNYHELSIVKHQVDLFDTLHLEEADRTAVYCDNPLVPLDKTNICWRALDAINAFLGARYAAVISIEKKIPVMGGLAGGSANAAETIRLINQLWDLRLSNETMAKIGRTLGMDVPYFFTGSTALDTEATGIIEPIPTMVRRDFLLVLPDFGVSTRDAYQSIDYGLIGKETGKTRAMCEALMRGDADETLINMHNDFEISVFKSRPELARIKERLIELGCAAAAMSGSGSTMIGALNSGADPEKIRKGIGCKTLFVSSR